MTASSMRARKGLPGKSDADVPKVLHPLLVLLIPVGELVSIDGVLVGFGVGAEVGELVGESVGIGVGSRVGEEIGVGVGSSVENVVGKAVGTDMGEIVFVIGGEVGAEVGEVVGIGVGFRVGEEVGEGVGSSGVGGFWIGLAVGEFLLPLLLPPFPYLNPFLLFWFLF